MIFLLQLRVQAYDSASPDQKIYTEIVFPIKRNENSPQFTTQVFNADISENHALGVSIIQLTATDNDQVRNFPFIFVIVTTHVL